MSDCMSRKDLLDKIREVEFVTLELNLYLDTHPTCEKAFADFNYYADKLMKLKMLYEKEYGPLLNFGFSQNKTPWQWANEPWPWETGE